MKKKSIIILGSTGSIGETSLKVIRDNKKKFSIKILMANSNYRKIFNQIKKFKPKYYIVENYETFIKINKNNPNKKTKILNVYKKLDNKIIKSDILISAIPGLAGLLPTIKFLTQTKKLLIANKESIICGWNLIKNILKKKKIKFIPIDSEHFSIMKLLENNPSKNIEKIFLTASGGPFLNYDLKKIKNAKPNEAINHPKWKMGKKISVDSATLMNKILEVIEAQKIFSINNSKIEIIIHPESQVHAIVRFKNGLHKFLLHYPNMIVPISSALMDDNYSLNQKYKDIDLLRNNKTINKLSFRQVNKKVFPSIKLKPILDKYKSTPIIINAANEIFVDQYLKRKISFSGIIANLNKVLIDKNYKKYAIKSSNNIEDIYFIDNWARKTAIKKLSKKN